MSSCAEKHEMLTIKDDNNKWRQVKIIYGREEITVSGEILGLSRSRLISTVESFLSEKNGIPDAHGTEIYLHNDYYSIIEIYPSEIGVDACRMFEITSPLLTDSMEVPYALLRAIQYMKTTGTFEILSKNGRTNAISEYVYDKEKEMKICIRRNVYHNIITWRLIGDEVEITGNFDRLDGRRLLATVASYTEEWQNSICKPYKFEDYFINGNCSAIAIVQGDNHEIFTLNKVISDEKIRIKLSILKAIRYLGDSDLLISYRGGEGGHMYQLYPYMASEKDS